VRPLFSKLLFLSTLHSKLMSVEINAVARAILRRMEKTLAVD
jgi:hypothetical protein